MIAFSYQPALRPALPCVYGPLDYREQRALFQRIDSILSASGLEEEFIALTLAERAVSIHSATAARLERIAKYSALALRTNIARNLTGLDHREFATRLADSPLLQWFLRVGEMGIKQRRSGKVMPTKLRTSDCFVRDGGELHSETADLATLTHDT